MLDKSIPHIGVLMVKNDTDVYPHFNLPSGFTFSGYKSGYEIEWAKLIFESDMTDTLKEAEEIFKNEFLSMPDQLPGRCLFALDCYGKIVATGSLWFGEHFGKYLQRIHWIAQSQGYQGKGLIKALMTKLLDVYNELGFRDFIYLTSQTWSYKALNIYSKFGFYPYRGIKPINWKADNFDANNELALDIINKKINEYNQSKHINFSIRKAMPADAETLAFIICESWKSAYKDIITPEELERKTEINKRIDLFRELIPSEKGHLFIAFSEDVPCGFCYFCDSRDEDMPGYAEIASIYTLEQYWGKGIGRKIMDSALIEIKRLGYEKVMLWSFQDNLRARRFYEKCGFITDETTKDSKFGNVKEIRYFKML